MKRSLIALLVLAACVGCSDDDDNKKTKPGVGGSGGSTAGSGGSSTAGTGGSATAGTGGTGGSSTAGTGGSSAGGTGGSSTAGTGGAGGTGGAPLATESLLFTLTDYGTVAEIANIGLDGAILNNEVVDDQDSVAITDGHYAFIVERTTGTLHQLDAAGAPIQTIDLKEAPASASNPQGVVVIPGSSPLTAYVPLYGTNDLVRVDLDAGTVAERIDLSGENASEDSDGLVEQGNAWYDAASSRVWLTLQRITPVGFPFACNGATSALIALDTTTNTLVDLNGADAGTALELPQVNPVDSHYDAANNRLYLLSAGCHESAVRSNHGILSVDLATLTITEHLESTDDHAFSRLLWAPGGALVGSWQGSDFVWNEWTVGGSSLGGTRSLPSLLVHDGAGNLYSGQVDSTSGDKVIVQVDPADGSTTPIATNPFTTTGLSYEAISNGAYRAAP